MEIKSMLDVILGDSSSFIFHSVFFEFQNSIARVQVINYIQVHIRKVREKEAVDISYEQVHILYNEFKKLSAR